MKLKFKSPLPKIEPSRTSRVLRHFGHHLRPHKKALGSGALALLGLALVQIAQPWPLKIIFDYVLLPNSANNDWAFIQALQSWNPTAITGLASGLIIGLALLGAFFVQVQTLSFASVGQKVAGSIRLELFTHVQGLPRSYHDYR